MHVATSNLHEALLISRTKFWENKFAVHPCHFFLYDLFTVCGYRLVQTELRTQAVYSA